MKQKSSQIKILQSADQQIHKLLIKKQLSLQKALNSGDIDEIYKAQSYLNQIQKKDENVEGKSMIVDPQQWGAQGYKEKTFNLSYEMLRAMGRTSIIKPIIETRKEQILSFCEPQKDRYSTGFVIRPKKFKMKNGKADLTKAQEYRIEELTEFLLNCGTNPNEWHGDNFQSYSRKMIGDSLSLDQATVEIIADRRGQPAEFLATDGATYRLADSFNDDDTNTRANSNLRGEKIQGYYPYYVQVYQGRILAEFYPWELAFGIRNPQTSIYANGYGRSELEDLIENVTSMLNADQYNSNYFKVGANPKGILKVTGNVNPGRLEEFKNQWQATMTGVRNAHKMPIIEADKMDFISTQQSNKDMEYGRYQEFLIKVACAHYKIDPSEINFPMQGESGSGAGMFQGNNEQRLEFSKDKGLKPLLKWKQNLENKYIINRLDPDYELVYVGLDAEDPKNELDHDILAVQNFMTVNEVRRKRDMEDLPDGDVILNPVLMQQKMMEQQQAMGMNNGGSNVQDESHFTRSEEPNLIAESLEKDIENIFNR